LNGVKFYLKYQSNFFVLLDSIRNFELLLIEHNRVEKFYENLFSFIKLSLKQQQQQQHQNTAQMMKLNYLIKFYACLYMQYISICYNSNLNIEKLTIRNDLSILNTYLFNKSLYTLMNELDKEIQIVPKILDQLDQILDYLKNYQNKTTNKLNEIVLKEISTTEKNLLSSIHTIYIEIIESKANSYYETWILVYLFEILINKQITNSKFIQETQIKLFTNMCELHAKAIKVC